jgi:hypothetical protein
MRLFPAEFVHPFTDGIKLFLQPRRLIFEHPNFLLSGRVLVSSIIDGTVRPSWRNVPA